MNKYVMSLFLAVLISSFSQMLLKKSAMIQYDSKIKEYFNVWVISGYTLMIVSTLLVILSYRGVSYKNGPVIESLGFIIVLVLSKLLFNEEITFMKIIGNIIIILGIIVFYI